MLDGQQMITTEELSGFIGDIINAFNQMRSSFKDMTQEQEQSLNASLKSLNDEHDRILTDVEQATQESKSATTEAINAALREVKRISKEIMDMKPENGLDADEDAIVARVLAEIKLPEQKEILLDDREEIVKKINSGKKGDKKIEAKQIEGYENLTSKNDLNRAISILDERSQYLINRTVKHDATLTGSGTDSDPLKVVGGGGGGAVDSVNGQTGVVVLDTGDIAEATDANYVSDAQLVVIGNTSGTNTGDNATNSQYSGLAASKANVAGSLTQFVGNTPHRVFYSDASGDVVELALGADGTFLKSNGASSAPTFATPAGSGDVSKVGTPVNNQIGVWTGDGTIEGTTGLTYDGSNFLLTGDIGATGTRITKGWFTDLQVTNAIAGSITGNAATVTTNANLTGVVTSVGNATAIADGALSIAKTSGLQAALDLKAPLISPTFTTSITGSYLTASEMLITDGSKNIVSAPVATYPSLTELTYLKGVTSAIQTQLNAKGAGTVTSVTSANGDATVANTTTTPVITIVAAPKWTTGRTLAITGDLAYTSPSLDGTGNVTAAGTLATVNSNVGSFGSATAAAIFTVNAKGLITAASSATITPAVGSITGLGTGVATALAVNVGSAGAPVTFNGALGTPSSGTVTNLTGTASININGTVGATTPSTGVFTTLVAGSTTSLLLGTAGSAVGNIGFRNATSGTATVAPPTGALGTYTVTLPNAASTLPIFGQQITFAGPTAARTVTLPDAAFTVARTDAAQTFTGTQTFSQVVTTNNAITATANAATVPITSRISTVTNNSAATLTITLTTTSAVDGQMVMVRVLDSSAAAQTITWVNTENSTVTAPVLSNGSTTLPLTVGFQYNSATSKWRCIASA